MMSCVKITTVRDLQQYKIFRYLLTFNSSKQAFILALRFRSSKGLVIFLYCMVLETGGSAVSPVWRLLGLSMVTGQMLPGQLAPVYW